MFIKKPQHRKFEYIPRFYVPEHDKDERRKRKLGFRNHSKFKKRGVSSIIVLLIGILIILWFIIRYI